MEAKSFRSKFVAVALPLLLIIPFITPANAQGLFDVGSNWLPTLGGNFADRGCNLEAAPLKLDV